MKFELKEIVQVKMWFNNARRRELSTSQSQMLEWSRTWVRQDAKTPTEKLSPAAAAPELKKCEKMQLWRILN
jgi:hypothetical protein